MINKMAINWPLEKQKACFCLIPVFLPKKSTPAYTPVLFDSLDLEVSFMVLLIEQLR